MTVRYEQKLFRRNRPLVPTLDRLALLRQSGVNFIPVGGGRTIRTMPLLEDTAINWRERFIESALLYICNPMIFSAQNLINDELADCRIIVEKRKSDGTWQEEQNTDLGYWFEQPNPNMDAYEFIRAYSTHFHTFGCVYPFMFQPGDILPNGKINQEINCFDIIFPARIAEDTVSNPYGIDWYYQPIGHTVDEILKLNPKNLYVDVIYNPVGHNIGIALPTNPLDAILKIHRLYIMTFRRFFESGARPSHLLTRIVDQTKDTGSLSITDEEIEAAVESIYRKVGTGGSRQDGWLGLRGDWRATKMGTDFKDLVSRELLNECQTAVGAVYKVPPSLFWAGLEAGGGRATRQQESIDFYNMKIKPLRQRILGNLSRFLVPLFEKGSTSRDYRLAADISESGLAQYAFTKQARLYERWYQLRAITRGVFLRYVNEDKYADTLDKSCYDEYYSGSNDSQGMTIGKEEQGVEGGPGGGGGGGTGQKE